MSENKSHDPFLHAVGSQLDEITDGIEPAVEEQLKRARQQAISHRVSQWYRRHPIISMAAAAGLAVAVILPLMNSQQADKLPGGILLSDLELLSEMEHFEQDLEFYTWVENELDAS